MKIYVVTEDDIEYDYDETPILMDVKLVRAYKTRDEAEKYADHTREVKEVELLD